MEEKSELSAKRISLLLKYFHNQTTIKESEELLQWFSKFNDQQLDWLLYEHWNKFKENDRPENINANDLLNKIHHTINLQKKPDRYVIKPFYMQIVNVLMKAAAILFIPLLLGFLVYYLDNKSEISPISTVISKNEVFTPFSSRTKFYLPDSTLVWLNSDSKLKYPNEFVSGVREVELTGEAYFQVKHDESRPFIVKTKDFNVTALGTTFNVQTWSNEFQTTLVNGKVNIENLNDKSIVTLKPGENASFDSKSDKITVKFVDPKYYMSWIDGKLIFNNENLESIAKKMERWFNCSIVIKDKRIKKLSYTCSIEMESLKEVIDLLIITAPEPLNYSYQPEKRLITIYRK